MTWFIILMVLGLCVATLGGLINRDRYGNRCLQCNDLILDTETLCKKCASEKIR